MRENGRIDTMKKKGTLTLKQMSKLYRDACETEKCDRCHLLLGETFLPMQVPMQENTEPAEIHYLNLCNSCEELFYDFMGLPWETKIQREIVRYQKQGLSLRRISKILNLAPSTLVYHLNKRKT